MLGHRVWAFGCCVEWSCAASARPSVAHLGFAVMNAGVPPCGGNLCCSQVQKAVSSFQICLCFLSFLFVINSLRRELLSLWLLNWPSKLIAESSWGSHFSSSQTVVRMRISWVLLNIADSGTPSRHPRPLYCVCCSVQTLRSSVLGCIGNCFVLLFCFQVAVICPLT